ncbi:MAG: DUF1353 domain-containing protein [Desulfobacterales bacterium]|jgi:hypothetical protein
MLFFQIVGIVSVALLLIIIVLFLLYLLLRKDITPLMADEDMPVLLPLAIPTKNRPFIMRVLVWLFDIRKWRLKKNWHFFLENGDEIVLPKGFEFDGASIPRIFWAILSPVGLLLIPGLIHDYGYRYKQLWFKNVSGQIEPYLKDAGRKVWDDLFREVGIYVNGFAIIDFIAWIGVRVGGGFAWCKHRKENEIPKPPVI